VKLIAFLFVLCAAAPAVAQDIELGEEIDAGMLEERRLKGLEQASGFIVDRTITHFGAEFLRQFSLSWRELPGTEEFDVAVFERPTARQGSLVWVEHNHRPIARAYLYAGRAANVRPIAVATADYVAKELADDVLAGALFNDPDLAKEGF
jgi:curli production assembly/transport component CsgE